MLKLTIVIGFLFTVFCAHAENRIKNSLNKLPIVTKIEFRGLNRTKPFVVLRELQFSINETLTTEKLLTSIQNLKNLEIFSHVIPLLELDDNNQVTVIISFSEKWTIIPYLSYSSGGGTRYIYAGVYDINAFGNYVEVGAQYDNWNGQHGVLGWYINRRIFNQRTTLKLVAGSTLRPRNLLTRNGELEGEYVLSRNQFTFSFTKELQTWFRTGAALKFQEDRIFSAAYKESLNPQLKTQLNSSRANTNKFVSLFLHLGKLNRDNYLTEGKLSSLVLEYGGNYTNSDTSIKKFQWENMAYWRLPYQGNIALRFRLEQTNAETVQHLFYVGGFEHIRGYFDGQLRSKAYWQANTEYRIPSFRSNWLVLQHVFFIDAVQIADKLSQLQDERRLYYSAGVGLRVISPKIYSFNGRLDIALITTGESKNMISFGAQQFF